SAVSLPSMNVSKGVWSETSRRSYSLTANPKNKEKLNSITVNRVAVGVPWSMTGVEPEISTTQPGAFHQVGLNACLIRSAYLALMPLAPAAVFWLLYGPRILSSVATSCCPSAVRLALNIFLPSCGKSRPKNDISKSLSGGPSACEAADMNVARICVNTGGLFVNESTVTVVAFGPAGDFTTIALGSRAPKGFTPLNSNLARPSQKLRRLKTALMVVGVLRGSTFLTRTPFTLNTAPLPVSKAVPESLGMPMALNWALNTPMEDATSLVSLATWLASLICEVSFGSNSRWNGKSALIN